MLSFLQLPTGTLFDAFVSVHVFSRVWCLGCQLWENHHLTVHGILLQVVSPIVRLPLPLPSKLAETAVASCSQVLIPTPRLLSIYLLTVCFTASAAPRAMLFTCSLVFCVQRRADLSFAVALSLVVGDALDTFV
ncbi:hypothetical protein Nepgr_015606 [Nepenthes gracilis]|uniref:Uncharacterized protein n=1 Tax=Nepenthes gracilis TaxID=150966 RepID=A0AAD3SN55_NEPGR|nr:hypothetical protein Nepgr_015606 [Nepenthes gracilis]